MIKDLNLVMTASGAGIEAGIVLKTLKLDICCG
jgi:hypothetical protein